MSLGDAPVSTGGDGFTDRFSGLFSDRASFHQPFWCEENAWHLCAHAALSRHETIVAMITGPRAGWNVRCGAQRAAGARGVLDWDYHVMVFARALPTGADGAAAPADSLGAWQAFDPDSTLPMPCPAATWLDGTFLPAAPPWLAPFFRVFSGAEYRRVLSSDRAHMRRGDGWRKPPPPWPAIGGHPANLRDLLDPTRWAPGEVVDLDQLRARLTGGT